MMNLINGFDDENAQKFLKRIDNLKRTYDEMSEIYQQSKGTADIPLN